MRCVCEPPLLVACVRRRRAATSRGFATPCSGCATGDAAASCSASASASARRGPLTAVRIASHRIASHRAAGVSRHSSVRRRLRPDGAVACCGHAEVAGAEVGAALRHVCAVPLLPWPGAAPSQAPRRSRVRTAHAPRTNRVRTAPQDGVGMSCKFFGACSEWSVGLAGDNPARRGIHPRHGMTLGSHGAASTARRGTGSPCIPRRVVSRTAWRGGGTPAHREGFSSRGQC
jgi:hypothetical protein